MCRVLLLIFLQAVLWLAPLHAAETRLDGELEVRARALFHQLRCVVCQNQSIGDSDADVARDLREIVREQLVQGKSDKEITGFLVDRYGEFILLKPVLAWHTFVLWGAPVLLLMLGGGLAWRVVSKKSVVQDKAPLSDMEQAELENVLNNHG